MRKILIVCCLLSLVPKIALAKIVFSSNREGNYEIYVMSDNGNNLKRLTYNLVRDYQPRWSPDGKQIAYRYEDPEVGKSIYTMSTTGRRQKPLIPPKNGPILRFSPAWAPDSQRIVFCEMEWLKAKPDVRLIIYDTVSKRQQIRYLPRGLQGACWMGNDAILFSAIEDKSDKYDIYRYHIVSDKIINLTNTPQIQEYKPHWIDDRALDVSPPEKKTTQWGKVKAD